MKKKKLITKVVEPQKNDKIYFYLEKEFYKKKSKSK